MSLQTHVPVPVLYIKTCTTNTLASLQVHILKSYIITTINYSSQGLCWFENLLGPRDPFGQGHSMSHRFEGLPPGYLWAMSHNSTVNSV